MKILLGTVAALVVFTQSAGLSAFAQAGPNGSCTLNDKVYSHGFRLNKTTHCGNGVWSTNDTSDIAAFGCVFADTFYSVGATLAATGQLDESGKRAGEAQYLQSCEDSGQWSAPKKP